MVEANDKQGPKLQNLGAPLISTEALDLENDEGIDF